MPRSSATHPEDVTEQYRTLAAKLLKERYSGNQAAFARDLSIGAANINRFVIRRQGGISSKTAERLLELSKAPHSSPPPSSRVHVPSAPQMNELEKTLDFFQDRWPEDIATIARLLATSRGIDKDRNAWMEALDTIESCIDDIVTKLK